MSLDDERLDVGRTLVSMSKHKVPNMVGIFQKSAGIITNRIIFQTQEQGRSYPSRRLQLPGTLLHSVEVIEFLHMVFEKKRQTSVGVEKPFSFRNFRYTQ